MPAAKYRDLGFSAVLQRSPKAGGWTFVVWKDSVAFFGTRGLALGNGTHKLPIKADVRKAIGRDAGDEVHVRLLERLS